MTVLSIPFPEGHQYQTIIIEINHVDRVDNIRKNKDFYEKQRQKQHGKRSKENKN